MLLAQFALVCAAPLAACIVTPATTHAAERDDVDCCPAGSHPPGQCPLHRGGASSNECRLTCANQGRTAFIPGVAGVLPPAIGNSPVVVSEPTVVPPQPARTSASLPPISPPPKPLA